MNNPELLKLENQLCFPLYAASRKIIALYQPLLKELSLTYTQYITLLVLWEKKSITVKDLGSELYLDSGTLTPLLKKLEQMALVKRTRDRADERSVIVTLTEKGEALYQQALDIPEKLICKMKMEVKDAIALREQLKAFIKNIE